MAAASINDSSTTTEAWSAAKIIAYIDNKLDGLDYQADVLDIQADATLDPGATPTTGDRYIITDSASLHANFGTIAGIGNNDIVEYDGADFVVIYDVSAEGEGAIVWDRAANAWKQWTGSTWSNLTAAGESNTASNVGASGIGIFEQKTGVDLELRKLFGTNGLATSLNGSVVEVKLDFPGLATRDAIDVANDKIAYYSDSVGDEVLTDIENLLSFHSDTTPAVAAAVRRAVSERSVWFQRATSIWVRAMPGISPARSTPASRSTSQPRLRVQTGWRSVPTERRRTASTMAATWCTSTRCRRRGICRRIILDEFAGRLQRRHRSDRHRVQF